nr:hypothetical protein [Verrucomicrobiota bacterium]
MELLTGREATMPTVSQHFHGGHVEQAARAFGRPDFIDFSSNLNVFADAIPASQWAQWMDQISHYPEPDAHETRARLAAVYALAPEQILPTAGAIEALY